jgi:hypothetical protein
LALEVRDVDASRRGTAAADERLPIGGASVVAETTTTATSTTRAWMIKKRKSRA